MSLDKAIASGKEHRKPYYRRAPRIDRTCRCHGGCPSCLDDRMHKYKTREESAEFQEKEYEAG